MEKIFVTSKLDILYELLKDSWNLLSIEKINNEDLKEFLSQYELAADYTEVSQFFVLTKEGGFFIQKIDGGNETTKKYTLSCLHRC